MLRYYLKIYLRCATQYLKARMQYRVDFIISTIGMVFICTTTIFVFRVLFGTIPTLAGWNFNEILFIYGFYLLSITPTQFFFDNIWELRGSVMSGDFIKYYLKPLNTMFYFMSETMDIKGFTQLALGVAILSYSASRLGFEWNSMRVLLLVVVLFGSSLVAISIMVIAGSTGFWLLDSSLPILNFALKIRDYAPFPTSVYEGLFRFIFTFLFPIGFVAFYPSQLFLRPDNAPWLAYASPIIGIAFFLIAYTVWNKGVNSYAGTGS